MEVRTVPASCPLCGPDYAREEVASGPDFEYRTTGEQEFRFTRCQTCDMVLLDPRPADDEIASLYPADYEPYRFDELPELVRRGRDLVQQRKVDVIRRRASPEARIVDVGCGAGAFLRLLRAKGPAGWKLVGWDYPGAHMDRLRDDGFEVIAAPVDRGAVPRDVDVFVLNQVIEHFADPADLIAMLADALAPGGIMLIETPDTNGIDARWFGNRHWGGYHIPRHLVLFNERNLRALTERAGLAMVETARLASPAFWVQSLHHRVVESPWKRLAPLLTIRNLPLVAAFTVVDLVRSKLGPTNNQRLIVTKSQ